MQALAPTWARIRSCRGTWVDIAAGVRQNTRFVFEPRFDFWRNDRVSQLVRAKITALGAYVPPRLLTNDDLEKLVETSNEWIVERTGIRERHIVDKGVATSDLATEAARRALAQRGLEPSDLDAILVATVTPDMFFPSTACLVQHKLGAKGVWGFDLSAACSAFVYALQTGAQFIATGVHKRVMVIGADVMSSIIDYNDRATCVIFGDGAGRGDPGAGRGRGGGPDRLHSRSGWFRRMFAVHAGRWQPPSRYPGNRGEENALRSSGRPGGFQIRRPQAG